VIQILRLIVCSMLITSIVGCSAINSTGNPLINSGPIVEIEGVEIRNELLSVVTDVQILVPQTGDFVGCGTILPNSSCSTTFPLRNYQGNAVNVSWKEQGRMHTTDDFVIKIPAALDTTKPARILVLIFAIGQAGAKLVQD
jgi:hypothetical protein